MTVRDNNDKIIEKKYKTKKNKKNSKISAQRRRKIGYDITKRTGMFKLTPIMDDCFME